MRKPLLLGHRGARAVKTIPENTIRSFDLALKHGCDGFEFDVRLAGDGNAVICHDAETGGVLISEATHNQLRLPRLDQVLAHYAARAFLNIELKVAGLESALLIALAQSPPQRGYVVSSFLPDVLSSLRLRDPQIPLGFICDRRRELDRWRELPIQYVVPHYSLVTAALVQQVHDEGKILFTWTVNDKAAMLRLAEWNVDGIISDETELLVGTFRT